MVCDFCLTLYRKLFLVLSQFFFLTLTSMMTDISIGDGIDEKQFIYFTIVHSVQASRVTQGRELINEVVRAYSGREVGCLNFYFLIEVFLL